MAEIERARGMRDFLPEEEILRSKVRASLRQVFERYGYSPLETPALERYEVLASKYAGGSEILKETFSLEDQGGRRLGLRYDLTVPLCRVIAQNPNLKMPFKRYQIGPVWRDGPISFSRYREFFQCDVDVVGSEGMAADAEIILLINDAFKALGFQPLIKLNNRKVLAGIAAAAGIPDQSQQEEVILSLDKLDKLGREEVAKELEKKGCSPGQIERLFQIALLEEKDNPALSEKGARIANLPAVCNPALLEKVKPLLKAGEAQQGVEELQALLAYLPSEVKNVQVSLCLARGLSYYTGTVYEVFLPGSSVASALCAGGRYDRIIGSFLGAERQYPAVGVSFGLDRICDALSEKEKTKTKASGARSTVPRSITQVYVIPIGLEKEALTIVQKLREAGVNTDWAFSKRNLSKNLEYASSQGIPYVLFIGKKELEEKKVKLRQMQSGEEKLVSLEECLALLAEGF